MNIYIETTMNMAHREVDSEFQIRSDNTKKADQITTVKWINIYVETISFRHSFLDLLGLALIEIYL